MAFARHFPCIAINAEDPLLVRQAPGHDCLVIRLGKDFVSEVAGQIKFGFSPSNGEGARQLLVRLGGQPPPTSELTRLDRPSDANARDRAGAANVTTAPVALEVA